MNCMTCKFAVWSKTKNGRLHPDGDGRCTWKVPVFAVPIAFWFSFNRTGELPQPSGGFISRRGVLKDCPAWEPHEVTARTLLTSEAAVE